MLAVSASHHSTRALVACVEFSATIEDLARTDPLEARRCLQSLGGDIARYACSVGDARPDLVTRATALAAVVDRLVDDLASGRVHSITGLRRQLVQLLNASQATPNLKRYLGCDV